MAKFSEIQRFLFEDYLNHLTLEGTGGTRKSYLKSINTNIVTKGSFWIDLYVTDPGDDFNFKKIEVQPRKIEEDYFTFLEKGDA